MKKTIFVGLFLLPAVAQADPRDDALSAVLRCSSVSDKGQRLACYDSAVVRVPGAMHAQRSPAAAAPIAAAPIVAAPVASAPASAAPAIAATVTTASAAPGRRRSESFLDHLFGSGPNRAPQTTVAEFGSESIANGGTKAYPQPMDNDTIDEISARLVRYEMSGGYLVATLDNGQVWRQVTGEPVGHLERAAASYTVTVSRGGAGAYALKLSHFGRTLAVRRIH